MEWDWSYESESVHLTMLPSFLTEVGAEFEKQDGECPQLLPFFRTLDHGLNSLLHQLRKETTGDGLGKDLVTSSLLQLIAARVYRISKASLAATSTDRDPAGFSASDCRRSLEILNDRLDENIALAELAAEFNLSPFHFSRMFKRATGFPPHEYQVQLRVARACELLCRNPRKRVADIACELGFADESHFRRHFRRIVGTTPSQFRTQQ
ncbi:MAG: AraC family transcriptional regulator [Gammaproteobacteria bacterium]